jgi:hypothetical protein
MTYTGTSISPQLVVKKATAACESLSAYPHGACQAILFQISSAQCPYPHPTTTLPSVSIDPTPPSTPLEQ